MRVLNVIDSLQVGGAERYLSRVAPLLRHRHGIELDICVLSGVGQLLEDVRAQGVPVFVAAPERERSGPALYSKLQAALITAGSIASLIRRRQYDVVHSYLFSAELLGTLAARLTRRRRVIVSRRALHPFRRPPGLLFDALQLVTNVLADELIANSWTVMRDVERTETWLPSTRTVIYNGIDVADYPLASPRASGPLKLVAVGRLGVPKGQEFAIAALRLVLDAGLDAELTLVGSGPNERSLRQAAASLGLGMRVVFAGLTMDPRPFLREADVFVLPSSREGFSNALLEAMATGLTAIATNVGGNAEALINGEGGLIVPAEDSKALAGAILQLARQRSALVEMGRTNRERVATHFSLEMSVDQLAAWYMR